MTDVKRSVRVAERVREEIASALEREIDDPRLRRVVVTRVEVTDDLQHARVLVRLTHDDGPEARSNVLRGFRSAGAILRRRIGANLDLRRTPELRFFIDEGQDAQARIEELLAEIERERG